MFMRWNTGNQFPIIAPGYGYLSRVISGATAKWGNQKKENSYCITHSTLDFKNQFPIICTWLVLRNAHLRTSNESCLPFPESNKTLEQNRQSHHSQITVRSTVRSQSDHSPIICFTTISHYSPEKNLQIWKGIFFFSREHLKLLVKYMIGLWSDCDLTVDRTVIGL